MTIHDIVEELKKGNFDIANNNLMLINDTAMELLDLPDETIKNNKELLDTLIDIIAIGNITYNYGDTEILPIDDGVYDLLVTKLQRIDYNRFTPGALPVSFESKQEDFKSSIDEEDMIKPFIRMTEEEMEKYKECFYPSILEMNKPFDPENNYIKPFYTKYTGGEYISKRIRNVSHNYPNLVGTLEKCKFVLDKQAKDMGTYEEQNVHIFERDFMVPLLQDGIINMNTPIEMIGTLKYDGVSIEADVTDHIISARTRGDTDINAASDLTPIFEGYKFPDARPLDKPIGMKFEAIVLYEDLAALNRIFGTNYINGRTAIIGILGSSDARRMRDFITLIPLQCDFGPDTVQPTRLEEILFLNKYYTTKEYLRYTVFKETYTSLLFLISKYVSEAEYFRKFSKFMYDGVVLEFTDPTIRNTLGRKNSINQYAMAIKFNPLKRLTTFTGYTYTIGQDGAVTPMIHYKPIEFLGSIHTKSTGSSYARFKSLNLYIGDQIEVTYVNDVMPYVTKPDIEYNRKNHCRAPLPEEEFITECPYCGSKLIESSNGATVYCPNIKCPQRSIQRMTNMMSKLGIKDFSQASMELLRDNHLYELMNRTPDDMAILGPTNRIKLYNELNKLRTNPLPDYRIIGALGFTNVAAKKWKLIFSRYTLKDIFIIYKAEARGEDTLTTKYWLYESLKDLLANIKGVGPVTAETISSEMSFFEKDIEYIITNNMYLETPIGNGEAKYQIRFSGFRDQLLADVLNKFNCIDCDPDASVTKKTSILLVPYMGMTSSKVTKATTYGIPIVPIKEFLDNPSMYIPEISEIDF